MSKTTQTEIEYKRLITKRKHQYLKPRKCHKNSVRLETIDVSTSVTGVPPSADVPLSLTKSDSCWSRCRDRVMGMFTFLFRDDVVKLVVGKSRFDSERSPVPYRTQSVSVSFSIFFKKREFYFSWNRLKSSLESCMSLWKLSLIMISQKIQNDGCLQDHIMQTLQPWTLRTIRSG